ncbi:XAC2610-related protein [Deinococcus altitudinis]|uniref:XAC2610-related protein n=1 Tax=Deinococcus altitudinis TaxID=468914 RepID=UPI0038916B67
MLLALPPLAPNEFSCAALRRGVSFEVRPGVKATLKLSGSSNFSLQTGRQKLQLSGQCATEPGLDLTAVADDFNFDGRKDLIIRTSTSNITGFYDLYLYRPRTGTFEKNRYDGSAEFDVVGNGSPSVDPLTRTVTNAYRSGVSSALLTLCLTTDGQNLYPCRLATPAEGAHARNADDYDWTWYDPLGNALEVRPLQQSEDDRSLWNVLPSRLPLHAAPSAGSPAAAYVVRGDQVEVLELRGNRETGWAHVSYRGRGATGFPAAGFGGRPSARIARFRC